MDKINLYNIYKLSASSYAEKALSDKELYSEIVNHQYSRLGGVDCNQHDPKTIHPIPDYEAIEAWKQDYTRMQEHMIYGGSSNFNEMIETIKQFTSRINALDWNINHNILTL